MQFSQGQSLNSRIAAFEIFQLRQVELNGVNVTPFNRWHIFKTAHVITGHPPILERAGIVRSTARAVGAQQSFYGELREHLIIAVQQAPSNFLFDVHQQRSQGVRQEKKVHTLQTGCPAALLCRMPNHIGRNAEPAADFLNAE